MTNKNKRRTLLLASISTIGMPFSSHAANNAIEIGLLPNISSRILLAQYQPMRDFLMRKLARQVQISTAANWDVFFQRTAALEYDIVITASNLARVAQLDFGYVPLLCYEPNNKGLIAFAKERPLKDIRDLKGQTLVLSNPKSIVALRSLQWFEEKGLQKGKHYKTIDTPTDDSVGNVVVRGDAIAALLSGGEFKAIPEAIKAQMQIFATVAEVPGFIVLANPKFAATDAQAVKAQLLQFATNSEEGKAFFASSGFSNIREIPAGFLESIDPFVAATRKLFAQPG